MGTYERELPYTRLNPDAEDREGFAQFLESIARYIRENELSWIDGRVSHSRTVPDILAERMEPVDLARPVEIENELTFYVALRRVR